MELTNGRLDLIFGNSDQLALGFLDKEEGKVLHLLVSRLLTPFMLAKERL